MSHGIRHLIQRGIAVVLECVTRQVIARLISLPGTEGAGITDVLFGDYPFVGKLPVTWPNAVTQEPVNNGDGKTGLFSFGFGITPY